MNKLVSRGSPFSLAPVVWVPVLLILGGAVAMLVGRSLQNASEEQAESASLSGRLFEIDELRQPVHWHADFAVFIRGEQFDFNTAQFVSKEGEEKNPWVHIHEPRSTVVHAHREQTTWSEFLTSLSFKLTDTSITLPTGEVLSNTDTEQLKFFVNGVEIDTLMFQDILDLNQVLITYGSESSDEVLQTQWPLVTDEACIPSGLCKERGLPTEETCGKGSTTCTG